MYCSKITVNVAMTSLFLYKKTNLPCKCCVIMIVPHLIGDIVLLSSASIKRGCFIKDNPLYGSCYDDQLVAAGQASKTPGKQLILLGETVARHVMGVSKKNVSNKLI